MYLQTAAHSVPNIQQQPIQIYHGQNPIPGKAKLDAITEQIANTQDAALKALERIEDGSAKRMWEAQKAVPSATWIGDLMDRLMGWGKYFPGTAKRSATEEHNTLQWTCPTNDIYRYNMTTSYESEAGTSPDASCLYINSTDYKVLTQRANPIRKIEGPDDIICRVDACVVYYLQACIPHCFPCQNATAIEKTTFLNETMWEQTIWSGVDNMVWLLRISPENPETKINKWKQEQILTLFKNTVAFCVQRTTSEKDNRVYYAFVIIPVAIAVGVVAYIKQVKAKEQIAFIKENNPSQKPYVNI